LVSFSRDDLVGGFISSTARDGSGAPFAVLANRRFASVTSIMVSYKFVLFSISLASELAPDDDYAAALDAIRNIK
jgi:hypothetical protein